jgi:hypothetical protein
VIERGELGVYGLAVPLPFYNGLLWWWRGRFICECGARFWRERIYRLHWMAAHGIRQVSARIGEAYDEGVRVGHENARAESERAR